MTHEDKFSRNPRAPRKLVPSETRFLLTSTGAGAGAGAGSQLPPSRSLTRLANDSALLSLTLREDDVDFETFLRRFVWSIEALLANMWKIHGVPRAVAQQLHILYDSSQIWRQAPHVCCHAIWDPFTRKLWLGSVLAAERALIWAFQGW